MRFSFPKLLELYASRRASDPRDKVYGLRGLWLSENNSHTKLYFQPRYGGLVEKTYRGMVLDCISYSSSLEILEHLGCVYKSSLRLPSWSMDWRAYEIPNFVEDVRSWMWIYFCASGSLRFPMAQTDDTEILRLSGIRFDVVTQAAATLSCDYGLEEVQKLRRCVKISQDWRALMNATQDGQERYPAGGTLRDAFAETLCAGRVVMSHEPLDVESQKQEWATWSMLTHLSSQEFEATIPAMLSQPYLDVILSRYRLAVECMASNRCFFITSRGFIGLGNPRTRVGDEVFVLKGGRPLFILLPSQAGEHGATHAILGAAYIHRIMNGEAVCQDTEWRDVFLA